MAPWRRTALGREVGVTQELGVASRPSSSAAGRLGVAGNIRKPHKNARYIKQTETLEREGFSYAENKRAPSTTNK